MVVAEDENGGRSAVRERVLAEHAGTAKVQTRDCIRRRCVRQDARREAAPTHLSIFPAGALMDFMFPASRIAHLSSIEYRADRGIKSPARKQERSAQLARKRRAARERQRMLAKRIIPCLDVDHGRVVKGTNFLNLKDAGDPVAVAARYDLEGADELVFLDITASHEGRAILLDVVRRTAEVCFMPLTVGGGIRSLDDIRMLLKRGGGQGLDQLGRGARPRAGAAGGPPVRQPVHRGQHRSQAGRSRRP